MLPKEHFDRIEKDAVDMVNTKTEEINKRVVEISENTIGKTTKSSPDDEDDDEDDYEYDYNYDYKDDIVNITQKPTTTTKRKLNRFYFENQIVISL